MLQSVVSVLQGSCTFNKQLPDAIGPNTFYCNEHGGTVLNYSIILTESSNFSDF